MNTGVLGLALLAVLAMPPVATRMEALMATHMGLQMPLLLLAGYWIGRALERRQPTWLRASNAGGIAGTLLAGFTLTFWMLPRWLDGALGSEGIELAKFVSLPLLAGVPLALSWPHLTPVLRAFIRLNVLSMLGFMGWLYSVAPTRLCNNYLLDQQAILGVTLFGWTAALALLWALRPLFGQSGPPGEPSD